MDESCEYVNIEMNTKLLKVSLRANTQERNYAFLTEVN